MAAKLIDLRPTPAASPDEANGAPTPLLRQRFPPPAGNTADNPVGLGPAAAAYGEALRSPVVAALLKDPTGFMVGLRVAVILAMVLRLLRFVGVGGLKVLPIAAIVACTYLAVATGVFAPWLR